MMESTKNRQSSELAEPLDRPMTRRILALGLTIPLSILARADEVIE